MDIREEIERTVRETMFQREWIVPPSVRFAVADALMPLVARIQAEAKAEALREAANQAWKVWNVKPRVEDWLRARADRQENPS